MRQHKSIAANIPARLQADPVMHQANRSDALDIGVIEPAIEQPSPMRGLRTDQPRHLIIANNFYKNGFRRQLTIETVEYFWQRLFDNRPEFAQRLSCLLVDAHEPQPGIAVISLSSLIISLHNRILCDPPLNFS